MKVFYLSDLHLRSEVEANSQRLIAFLQSVPGPGDTLVLGGDIFDLFIGNKSYFCLKFRSILDALKMLASRGCEIHYLEGNHDFHLRGIFKEQKNIHIHANDFAFEKAGKRFWISHGDWIDEEDKGYRFLRRLTRSTPLVLLLKILPGSLIGGIGDWSSRKSRQYNDVDKIGTQKQERTRGLFREFARMHIGAGNDFVLVGHSHLKDQLKLKSNSREGEYLNLGFSAKELLFASWEPEGSAFTVDCFLS